MNVLTMERQERSVAMRVMPNVELSSVPGLCAELVMARSSKDTSPAADGSLDRLAIYLQSSDRSHSLLIAHFHTAPDVRRPLRLAMVALTNDMHADKPIIVQYSDIRIERSALDFKEAIRQANELWKVSSESQRKQMREDFIAPPGCWIPTGPKLKVKISDPLRSYTKQSEDSALPKVSSATTPPLEAVVKGVSCRAIAEDGELVCREGAGAESSSSLDERPPVCLSQEPRVDPLESHINERETGSAEDKYNNSLFVRSCDPVTSESDHCTEISHHVAQR